MSIVSWAEFKEIVDKSRPKTRRFRNLDSDGNSFPLYRGQASSNWILESTLTRDFPERTSLAKYLLDCNSARRVIGNYLPSSISFNEHPDPHYDSIQVEFPNIEYLAYLRHHGFPSPLLDWSASPYVAAFFAFRNVPESTEFVRIYSYRSHKDGHKSYSPNRHHLLSIGPFFSAHERHAVQQCWYTVAVKKVGDDCVLASHKDALESAKISGHGFDQVETFDISVSERELALSDLSFMNITAYTLFRSVDSLIETTIPRLFGAGSEHG